MEILVWMLVGGALGWISCRQLGFNQERGAVVSSVIGALGALVGGKGIAPIFVATATPADSGALALVVAAVVAAACLVVGDKLQRWGV